MHSHVKFRWKYTMVTSSWSEDEEVRWVTELLCVDEVVWLIMINIIMVFQSAPDINHDWDKVLYQESPAITFVQSFYYQLSDEKWNWPDEAINKQYITSPHRRQGPDSVGSFVSYIPFTRAANGQQVLSDGLCQPYAWGRFIKLLSSLRVSSFYRCGSNLADILSVFN